MCWATTALRNQAQDSPQVADWPEGLGTWKEYYG
jgi:hypothetical protein